MHVDSEHVRQWMAEHDASVLPSSESARLARAVEALPWRGTSPDWSTLDVIKTDLESRDLWDAVGTSRLGRHQHGFLLYSPDEPGVIASLRDLLQDIDLLSWGAPGLRFVCGADPVSGGWRLDVEALGAYDGADHLVLRT